MDATISVICYKSKYKSLKISVADKHWDFDKNVPKPNYPSKNLSINYHIRNCV